MGLLPTSRTRRSAPKTRSGCASCKKSHVKCSEDKPECHRCIRLTLKCIYTDKMHAYAKPRTILPATNYAITSQPKCISGLSNIEASYCDYFKTKVAPTNDVEYLGKCPSFWLRTIPREAMIDEGVRHLVTALGALDFALNQVEDHSPRADSIALPKPIRNVHYTAALEFYGKAIKYFRTNIIHQDMQVQPRTLLIYCILQTIFESLQGNPDGLRRVAHSGFEVLKRYTLQDDMPIAAAIDDEGIEEIEVYLSRFVVTADLIGLPGIIQKTSIRISVPICIQIPDAATSTLRMGVVFNGFYSRVIAWVLEATKLKAIEAGDIQSTTTETCILISQLQEWVAYIQFRISKGVECLDIVRLQMHQIDANFGIVLLLCFMHDCAWATYSKKCLDILSLARQMVQGVINCRSRSRIVQGILNQTLMRVLHRVIQRCDDGEVRRQGLEVCAMIMSYSDYEMLQIHAMSITQTTAIHPENDSTFETSFNPNNKYVKIGYTWNPESNIFQATVKDGTGAQIRSLVEANCSSSLAF